MQIKTKAIVLSVLKFQEKSLIVKCFTQKDGLKSYFVRSAFSPKKSNQKIAYFQPLNILEIDANHKNKGNLEHFKEVKLAFPYQTINTNIYKSTIVIFLSEVLHYSIQEEEKNIKLFEFLETALLWLDTHNEISNFHLILLLEITKYLGFYPDISNRMLPYFETTEGVFSTYEGTSCLSKEETKLFNQLIDLKFEEKENVFAASERQILLKILLNYYSVHLSGFKKPKSLAVLTEVFS